MLRALVVVACLTAVACSSSSSKPGPDAPGEFVPAHATFPLVNGARSLAVEVWYPASAETPAGKGESIESYVGAEADRARYHDLLAAAPATCATRTLHAVRDAAPLAGKWPLVVFSHCFGCTRFSSASIAERLASHGIAVAAPDHTGDTLFDALDGDGLPLDTTTLALRASDVRAVLDALLDGSRTEAPASLRGHFDETKVGAFGHSFGSVTTGLASQQDVRIKAAAGLAAPMSNALLPGVDITALTQPLLLLLAREDNSITELGNENIRDNFEKSTTPTRLVEVADAGHWSFSDIAGLRAEVMPGCGRAKRQTNPAVEFDYLPNADGIAIGQAYVTAFFLSTLAGDADATAFLAAKPADAHVTIDSK